MILTPLHIDLRRVIPARILYKGALLPHLGLDLLDVIKIVSEGGVYIGERDGRDVSNDLVRRKPLMLLPSDDVEHANTVTGNTCPPAADFWCLDDPLTCGAAHD